MELPGRGKRGDQRSRRTERCQSSVGPGNRIGLVGLQGDVKDVKRWRSGDAEFDRVTGGGLGEGQRRPDWWRSRHRQINLVATNGRRPGKSSKRPLRVAYVSGEESVDQVRMRASRLGVDDTSVQLASATSVRDILATFDRSNQEPEAVDVVIIDLFKRYIWTRWTAHPDRSRRYAARPKN